MNLTRQAGWLALASLSFAWLAPAQTIAPSLSQITFNFAAPGAAAQTRSLPVSVTAGTGLTLSAAATATGGNWLTVTPSSVTGPQGIVSFNVAADPTGLAAGNYSGQITLTMPPAAPVTVPVTVTVAQAGQTGGITLSPTTVSLSGAVGGMPVSQTVAVNAPQGSAAVNFTAAATSQGNWLSVTPLTGSTPTQLTVTASPGLLSAGTYTGAVNVSPTGGTAVPLNVTLTIGGGTPGQNGLTANPTTLTFAVAPNSGPSAVQTLTVSSASAQLTNISAVPSTASGGNWLSVTPLSGSSPLSLSVSVNPQSLVAGSYTGSISVNAVGSTDPPLSIPVTLTVQSTQTSNLTASPTSLTFNVPPSGSRTQSQTVSLTSSGGTPLQVTAAVLGAGWIAANPPNVTTPGTITVSINANGIADGTYQATLNLTSPGAAQVSIPITLNIGASASGQFETFPSTLSFNVQQGQPASGVRLISVGGTGTGTFTASATTASGGSWLQVLPASGSTPGVVVAGLSSSVVSSLAAGTYNGQLQ